MRLVPMEKTINSFESNIAEFQSALQDVLDHPDALNKIIDPRVGSKLNSSQSCE